MNRNDLPAYAVKINGSYIEDLISGYRTLGAHNKEVLERQFEIVDKPKDGATTKSSRYPAREITIDFVISGSSGDDCLTKMRRLLKILNTNDAEIIFNNEPDKYIIGTPYFDEDIDSHMAHRKGSFKIICTDPFFYGVIEKTLDETSAAWDSAEKKWTITYNGTYKTYPKLEADFPLTMDADGDSTSTSECGYVGFVNSNGAILQFGDPEETDWSDVQHPATNPLNKTFKSKSGWTQNGSSILGTGYTQTGTAAASSDGYIYASGYGSGISYHGPSLSYILTDATEAKNFAFSWKQKITATKSQFGCAEILLYNKNGGTRTLIAGVSIVKSTKDTNCKIYFYAGSRSSKANASVACSKIGSSTITKNGSSINIEIAGLKKTYSCANIEDLIVNEVVFYFGKNGTKTVLGTNRVYNCSLKRMSYSTYEDVANTFMPGDKLIVDTSKAYVSFDSGDGETPAPYLGDIGNQWEDFVLVPGTNVIQCAHSDWPETTDPPVFSMKYRERFL